MPYTLNVYALPKLVEPAELAGGTSLVIDVLRSSTTIVHALEAGAREVVPCLEVEDAVAAAAALPPGEAVLGGERQGLPIDGFDLANSPEEYTPYSVGDKTVILTTTNGTRALMHARQARRVLVGAFVNATAVFEQLLGQEKIDLICSGTDGQYSQDDVLLAGMFVERLSREGGLTYQHNAQALTAREYWLHRFPLPHAVGGEGLDTDRLIDELRMSLGGQNLVAIGLDDDIAACARVDQFQAVPELDTATFRIRAAL
jgi:2-phosphosulfolactate phosphatase